MNATSIHLPVEADTDAVYLALRDAVGEVERFAMHARAFTRSDFHDATVITLEHIAAMAAVSSELNYTLESLAEWASVIADAVDDLSALRRAQQERAQQEENE